MGLSVNRQIVFGFVLLNISIPNSALGGVYRCVSPSGAIQFQDRPCSASNQESLVPLQYTNSDLKAIRVKEKETQKQAKQQAVHDRRIKKQAKRSLHQLEKNKLKQSRQIVRCERIQKRIEHLENQLRQGCKIKRYNRIQEALENAQLMKKQCCSNERDR